MELPLIDVGEVGTGLDWEGRMTKSRTSNEYLLNPVRLPRAEATSGTSLTSLNKSGM